MYYTIIALDIEGYSKSYSTQEMKDKRDQLRTILQTSARTSDFERFAPSRVWYRDTGDGLFVFVDTRDYETVLRFLDETRRVAKAESRIRFRGVVHAGDCETTSEILHPQGGLSTDQQHNFVGPGFNEAARFVNSEALRNLLKNETHEYFVYGVSTRVFSEIANQHFLKGRDYAEYSVKVKDFVGAIYLDKSYRNLPDSDRVRQTLDAVVSDSFRGFLNTTMTSEYIETAADRKPKLYVFPNLSSDFEEKLGSKITRANTYLDGYCQTPRNAVISGGEQYGKTELAKETFLRVIGTGKMLPIYLKLTEAYSGGIWNKVTDAIAQQYTSPISDLENTKKIVIVDDFHRPQSKYQRRIIDELRSLRNTFFIVFVDNVFSLNFIEREITKEFDFLTIEEFSPSLRNELIQRWLDANNLEDRNFQTLDSYTDFVNTTLLKGLIPATPINLLVILAEKRAFNPLNSDVTSKGHCYQTLLYLALKKAAILDSEIDIYLNVLEHLAYHLYVSDKESLISDELDNFLSKYAEVYNLPHEIDHVKNKLARSRVFSQGSLGEYTFYSKYVYYFLVARYVAGHKSEPDIRREIQDIYGNLQLEKNGYVGVFIVHHLKDQDILEEIQLNLMVLYDKYDEATLHNEEVDFLLRHVSKLGQLSMSAMNESEMNRRKRLEIQDRDELASASHDNEEGFDLDSELASLRKALKTAEVMGHILKTRTGSFRITEQKAYYAEALKLYMRITKRFLEDFRKNESAFVEFFFDRVRSFNKDKLDKEAMYALATTYFFQLNALTYLACIRRSTALLASQQLLNIVTSVCDEINTPLAQMVKVHARMWHSKTVPIDWFHRLYDDGDAFTKRLIQQMLIGYCDLHEIDYKDKQRIADKFQINLHRIMVTDRTSSATD